MLRVAVARVQHVNVGNIFVQSLSISLEVRAEVNWKLAEPVVASDEA